MISKKSEKTILAPSRAGLDRLTQSTQDLLHGINKKDETERLCDLVKQLSADVIDIQYKLNFYSFVRTPNNQGSEFLRGLLDKSLKSRVQNAAHRDDIRQIIYVRLMKADPVFPRHLSGLVSIIVRNAIYDFYKIEKRHSQLANNDDLPRFELCQRLSRYENETEIGEHLQKLVDLIRLSNLPEKKKIFYRYCLENQERRVVMEKLSMGSTSYDRYKRYFLDFIKKHFEKLQ